MRRKTRLMHAGRSPEQYRGSVNAPVYRTSTVIFPTVKALREADFPTELTYGRYGTPTTREFEAAMAELEGGERAWALPSGQAAIVAAIMAQVEQGDHVLVTDNTYQPTRKFCTEVLQRFGVRTTFFDPMDPESISRLIEPTTKLVYAESPGSVTFEVTDLPAIARQLEGSNIKLLVDNTWAAGYFYKPLQLGADIVIQAATKYVGGHSDIMLGVVITSEKEWRYLMTRNRPMGYSVAPDICWLALRGLRTLPTRLKQHHENGLTVARWLAEQPDVLNVLHPALPNTPGHQIWRRDFTGASGLFSVLLKPAGPGAVEAMLDDLELFGIGASWGGFESLALPQNPRSIRTATSWQQDGNLVRLHIGLEDPEDLIADLAAGLERYRNA